MLGLHLFESFVDVLYRIELLVIDEALHSLSLEVTLDDGEASFDRVRCRRVGNIVQGHYVELFAQSLDVLCFVAFQVIHENS